MNYPNYLDGWETVELIGEGGFSKVYKIRKIDKSAGEYYSALKVIEIPSSEKEIQDYYNEGYTDSNITDIFKDKISQIVSEFELMSEFRGTANIVSYEDHSIVEKNGGKGYTILIRMELLKTLTYYQRKAPLPENDIVRLGMDICHALQLCASKNIVHRDIKPQNIFINKFGNFKLGDFGIARVMDHETHATKIGTLTYIAPEVYNGKPYAHQTDIYSLGLVLYWLLNERRLPFLPLPPKVPTSSENENAHFRRLNGEAIPAPLNGCEELKKVVLKACAPKKEERYQNVNEFLDALEEVNYLLKQGKATHVKPASPHPSEEFCHDYDMGGEPNRDFRSDERILEDIKKRAVAPADSAEDKKPNVSPAESKVKTTKGGKSGTVSSPNSEGETTPSKKTLEENVSFSDKTEPLVSPDSGGSSSIPKTEKPNSKKHILFTIIVALLLIVILLVAFQPKNDDVDSELPASTEEPSSTEEQSCEEPTSEVPSSEEPSIDVPSEVPSIDVPSEVPSIDVPSEVPSIDVPSEVEPSIDVPSEAPFEVPSEVPAASEEPFETPFEVPSEVPSATHAE